MKKHAMLLGICLLMLVFAPASIPITAQEILPTGNVIFFHPDGSALSHWNAARMYWYGPDGTLNWDQLPEIAIYRGHLTDRLTATSNGGATAHAFGYKVGGEHSFGRASTGEESTTRPINALSAYPGSIMRQAASAGYPVGIVNDGDVAEPGTGVFLAEVEDRDDSEEIVRQFLEGRPGFEGEALPRVILGGGEAYFLPEGTPECALEITLECHIHEDPINGSGPTRDDGRNLLIEAASLGYTIIRTRGELDELWLRLRSDPTYMPMVLGLFARDDTFNDRPEEFLIARRLTDPNREGTREGNLLLYGDRPDTLSYNPPTVAEMSELALEVLRRHSEASGLPFFLVAEAESVDNMGNNTNAIGILRALKNADDAVGVFREFIALNPNTLVLTAADSDAGGIQLIGPAPENSQDNVDASEGNLTGFGLELGFPLDGVEGQNTEPFESAPDSFGRVHSFAIGWVGAQDMAGAVIARAEGVNAALLRTEFYVRFDNTDVYRMLYATLFGELLPASYGQDAPTRPG